MEAATVRMKMRLRKGGLVEVKLSDGSSSYSWRCAYVVSGNGHHYRVRFQGATPPDAVPVRVPRKFIRLLPPPIGLCVLYSWSPSEEVEAVVNNAWCPAVVTAVGSGKIVVYLFGMVRKVRVRSCEIRLRRQRIDDQWTLVDQIKLIDHVLL